MPSKTSKSSRNRRSPWRVAPGCSESEAIGIARALASELQPGDRVVLEGPLGAGKTTFARALISALGVPSLPEGSPTFAIAHEYRSSRSEVVHMDLYRLKSEAELEDAGIPAYFWERQAIVLVEWLSLWPFFESAVKRDGRVWEVSLRVSADGGTRDLEIRRCF